MVITQIYDSVSGKEVERYLADLNELSSWWKAGSPNNGGVFESSDYNHTKITDATQKVVIKQGKQKYVFKNQADAKLWYVKVSLNPKEGK